mmetsp:Transcript_33222/g.84577  ORF Transcript_33222/g.84577 Transcript_33222/m.84577 type:complete len:212 (+) Transcript_33222:823-1458(+)
MPRRPRRQGRPTKPWRRPPPRSTKTMKVAAQRPAPPRAPPRSPPLWTWQSQLQPRSARRWPRPRWRCGRPPMRSLSTSRQVPLLHPESPLCYWTRNHQRFSKPRTSPPWRPRNLCATPRVRGRATAASWRHQQPEAAPRKYRAPQHTPTRFPPSAPATPAPRSGPVPVPRAPAQAAPSRLIAQGTSTSTTSSRRSRTRRGAAALQPFSGRP